MPFYHPEFLYGLFALAIPIIVHLFQLRRFKPEPFTNVALLQKLAISSRKSSKLKKWLSLITRMLIITALVLAFAQPYIPNANVETKAKDINIFIDNSFSMSLKGDNTSLFNQAKEELLETLPEDQNYSLITHDEVYKNLNTEDFKSLLYDLNLKPNALDIHEMLLKSESAFESSEKSSKELIVLSDFQYPSTRNDSLRLTSGINYHFVNYKAQNLLNFSIDTAFIESSAGEKLLNFEVSSSVASTQNIPVSIYDGKTLLSRLSLNFENEQKKTYTFSLEQEELPKGRIEIEDKGLTYDNVLYFSISKPQPINVLVISEEPSSYLDKIYQNERFQYKQVLIDKLEFAEISLADVVILNEIENISGALTIALKNYTDTNAVLAIVPAKEANLTSYNTLFNDLGLKPYSPLNKNEIKLTNINLDHPLFKGVFTENVQNFDYPTFDSYYAHFSPEKALSFSNGLSFLESKKQIFRFNAPIKSNSNFERSPLVVLSFYNLALFSQNIPILYLQMGDNYDVKLKENLQQDQVLKLSQDNFSFIPRQQTNGKTVSLRFEDYPETAGHYQLLNQANDTIGSLAFNGTRKESDLNYLKIEEHPSLKVYNTFKDYTQAFNENSKIKSLWQWFIALALIFMIIELLLLRFIK